MTRLLAALLWGAALASAALADQPASQPSPSAPRYYDFRFIFTNASYGNETVTGIVRGLSANGTSAAYSVEITGNSGGYGLGQYVGTPFDNTWTLSNGTIQSVAFISLGQGNAAPDVTGASLLISSAATPAEPVSAALSPQPNGAGISADGGTVLTFRVLRAYHHLPRRDPATIPAVPQADLIRTPGARLAIPRD